MASEWPVWLMFQQWNRKYADDGIDPRHRAFQPATVELFSEAVDMNHGCDGVMVGKYPAGTVANR